VQFFLKCGGGRLATARRGAAARYGALFPSGFPWQRGRQLKQIICPPGIISLCWHKKKKEKKLTEQARTRIGFPPHPSNSLNWRHYFPPKNCSDGARFVFDRVFRWKSEILRWKSEVVRGKSEVVRGKSEVMRGASEVMRANITRHVYRPRGHRQLPSYFIG